MNRVAAGAALPYPAIEPYENGLLDVESGQQVYWEACGNPLGKPALFVHGGPGGGCSSHDRRLFDPARYRIILFDQRGCGRSLPHAADRADLSANSTGQLVSDMEALRRTLGVDRWLLLGGSWGAALALAYAEAHRERVSALVLRGVFTARDCEIRWLYREGASFLFPDAWEQFAAPVAERERGDLVAAYHRLLNCGDARLERAAARAWCAWEDDISTLLPQPAASAPDDRALLARARIETHYFVNRSFLEEGQLIANSVRIAGIAGVIVQGRYDAVTPPATAWQLHRAWPSSRLEIVADAGHASIEPGIRRGLVAATDEFASLT